jgi:hypothetical protein
MVVKLGRLELEEFGLGGAEFSGVSLSAGLSTGSVVAGLGLVIARVIARAKVTRGEGSGGFGVEVDRGVRGGGCPLPSVSQTESKVSDSASEAESDCIKNTVDV